MAGLLRFLLAAYFPYLGIVCLGLLTAAVVLIIQAANGSWWLYFPALILFAAILHFLVPVFLALRHKEKKDWFELRLPREQLRGLYQLVEEVAEETGLRAPREVRLGADTAAHVYETKGGKEILVVGGLAVAAFDREALGGIIAHELAHLAAG